MVICYQKQEGKDSKIPLVSFSPNTKIKSADINANFEGLADGSLLLDGIIDARHRKNVINAGVVSIDNDTKVITGVGFEPKAVIFFMVNNGTSSAGRSSMGISVGTSFHTGSAQSANPGSNVGATHASNSDSIFEITASDTLRIVGRVTAVGSDGFTITCSTRSTTQDYAWIAIA